MVMSNAPPPIDEIESRPVLISESLPDRIIAVDGDRIFDFQSLERPANITEVFLKDELGCVYTDY